MLSRVADSLYWMGRYLERAENITRLLLVTEDFSTETQGLAEDLAQTAWKDMLTIFPSAQLTRDITPFAPLAVPYLQAFFTDQANAYSMLVSIRKARENARSVREALTLEVFLALNEAFRALEAYERKGMPLRRRFAALAPLWSLDRQGLPRGDLRARGAHRAGSHHREAPRRPSLRRRGADAPGRLRGLARPGGR
jgi:uncharacterized alpha-E superfamily protein